MRILSKWKRLAFDICRDVLAAWMALRDPAAPWLSKLVVLGSLLYAVSPVDLIADVIPILGWLDDLTVVPVSAYIAGWLMPSGMYQRLRDQAEAKLMRWGPKAVLYGALIIALWLILASVGAWMLWSRWQNSGGFGLHAVPQEATLPSPNVP